MQLHYRCLSSCFASFFGVCCSSPPLSLLLSFSLCLFQFAQSTTFSHQVEFHFSFSAFFLLFNALFIFAVFNFLRFSKVIGVASSKSFTFHVDYLCLACIFFCPLPSNFAHDLLQRFTEQPLLQHACLTNSQLTLMCTLINIQICPIHFTAPKLWSHLKVLLIV